VFFVVFTIFVVPLLPVQWHSYSYNILFTCIYFLAALSMERNKKSILRFAIAVFLVEWLSSLLELQYIYELSRFLTIVFFTLIVGNLITMIARAKVVSTKTIIEAINGYLLLSLVFGVIVMLLTLANPASFNFPSLAEGGTIDQFDFSESMYFSLVTTTTLGYGDIVPKTPLARSLATFMGVAGQFYIAIIVALLVGKYASQKSN
jgi:voltage-gated potassium channel Kch